MSPLLQWPHHGHSHTYSRFHKKRNDLRIHYRGGRRFVATFGVNNFPIYTAQCSFLVWGGPLDAGSSPSVLDKMIDTGSQPVIFKLLRFLWNLLYQWHCCSPNTHFSVSTNGRAGFPPTDQSQVRIGSSSFITVLIHTVAIGGSEDDSKASLIYYVSFKLYLNTADVKQNS